MKVITNPSMGRWLWLSLLVVVLDQATKWLAEDMLEAYRPLYLTPFFNLTLMYNDGAAFSFLSDAGGWQRWLFAGFALTMSLVLLIWLLRTETQKRVFAAALSLVIGGAIGNLMDRMETGRVVDFIQLHAGEWYWPAFNVADSAITVGVVLLLFSSLRDGPDE